MNEHTEKLVRELAEKLGTTVEHLWGVLIRQAPISATADFWVLVSLGIVCLICWVLALLLEHCDSRPFVVTLAIILTIAFVVCLCQVDMIAAGWHNPEYWALKQLLK